jgi:hypothetical protein
MKIAVIHAAFEETPRTVAFVEVGNVDVIGEIDALEYAYMRTNNISGSWSRDGHKDIEVMAELPVSERTGEVMGLRSTSMGDMMLLGNRKFKVAMCGFEEIV